MIDLARGVKLRDVPAGAEPEGLALEPDGRRLWVADRQGAELRVFDTDGMRLIAVVLGTWISRTVGNHITRSAAAIAIMAPLSVHSDSSG